MKELREALSGLGALILYGLLWAAGAGLIALILSQDGR